MSVIEWLNYSQPNVAIQLAQMGMYVGFAALGFVGGWLACRERNKQRHHHTWTRWKPVDVEFAHLSKGRVLTRTGTMQARKCTTCGKTETETI